MYNIMYFTLEGFKPQEECFEEAIYWEIPSM